MDRRTARLSAAVAAGTLAVLVLGDRAANVAVEHVVAGRLQDCLHTPGRPDVGIDGFPFVTDLVRRQFGTVTLSARDVDAGGVKVGELGAQMRGVKQRGDTATVDSLTGQGLVTYGDLSAMAPGVTVSYGGSEGGQGRLQMQVGFSVLSATAIATPRIVGDSVVVQPESLSSAFGTMDGSAIPAVTYKLRDLPAGVDVSMDPTERGIEFAFRGEDVSLKTDGSCPTA